MISLPVALTNFAVVWHTVAVAGPVVLFGIMLAGMLVVYWGSR